MTLDCTTMALATTTTPWPASWRQTALLPNVYDPQVINRFVYVRNNPVGLVDPDGHIPLIPMAIGALMGASVNLGLQIGTQVAQTGTVDIRRIDLTAVGVAAVGGAFLGTRRQPSDRPIDSSRRSSTGNQGWAFTKVVGECTIWAEGSWCS